MTVFFFIVFKYRLLGIGLEGGVNKIGDKWFECGWIAVIDKDVRLLWKFV